jgi:hypothetical protein
MLCDDPTVGSAFAEPDDRIRKIVSRAARARRSIGLSCRRAITLARAATAEVVSRAAPLVQQSSRDHAPTDVLKSPPFWLMYAMFVMVGTGGLMVTAQLAPFARDFAIDNVPVSMFGLTLPALGFALSPLMAPRS